MNKRVKQLLQENNRMCGLLSPEADRVLTDIVVYLRSAPISLYRQELIRRDITQMILDGERRGERVQDIVGADYQAFCDSVIAELPPLSRKERIVSGIGNGCLYLSVVMLIWFVFSLAAALVKGNLMLTVTYGYIFTGALILAMSVGIVEYIMKHSFDDNIKLEKRIVVPCAVLLMAVPVLSRILGSQVLVQVHAGAAAAVILLTFCVHLIIDRTID